MKRWLPLSVILTGLAAVIAIQWRHINTRANPQALLTPHLPQVQPTLPQPTLPDVTSPAQSQTQNS